MLRRQVSLSTMLTMTTFVALALGWCVLVRSKQPEVVFSSVGACGFVITAITLARRKCLPWQRVKIAFGLLACWLAIAFCSAVAAVVWQEGSEHVIAGAMCFGVPFLPVLFFLPLVFVVREWLWARYDQHEAHMDEERL